MLTGLWCAVGALLALWWPLPRVRYRSAAVTEGKPSRPRLRLGVGLVSALFAASVFVDPSVGLSVAILTVLGIWLRYRSSRRALAAREATDLIAALAAVTAELSIGTPPPAAFAHAGRELADRDTTIADTMRTLAARAALGGSPGTEPASPQSPIGSQWRRIALAWEIAHECGVPIKDLLESVRSDLAARRGFAARTNAGLAGPRATATVLALLPLLGIGLGQALGARPAAILCGGGLGGILLVVGTALGALGLWWSLRIADHVVAQA